MTQDERDEIRTLLDGHFERLQAMLEDHIRRAVTGATLPCSNVGTNDRPTYRISRSDLEAWLQKRKAGPLPPPNLTKAATALLESGDDTVVGTN